MRKKIYGFGPRPEDDEENELPQEEDLTNIGHAMKRMFVPADTIGSSHVELTSDQLKEKLENLMGTTFSTEDMTTVLLREGFKQVMAGNELFWLMRRK